MKKILLALGVVLFGGVAVHAQNFPYSYTYTNEPYITLDNVQEINVALAFDEIVPLAFGFTFQFDSVAYDFNYLDAGTAILYGNDPNVAENSNFLLFPYGIADFIVAKPTTKLRYKTDGIAPNRIFKFEAFDVGVGNILGRVDYQVWLYETSNIIQYRLGQQQVANFEDIFYYGEGPLIGFLSEITFDDNESAYTLEYSQWLIGNPPTDTVLYGFVGSLNAPPFECAGLPPVGSVFTFAPEGVSSLAAPNVPIFEFEIVPNPSSGTFSVSLPATLGTQSATVRVLDTRGAVVFSEKMPAGARTVTLPEGLSAGLYHVQVLHPQGIATRRLVKQ
jgi:hypothetical protein